MRFAVVSAFVLAALLVVSGGPAAADCIGPTIEITQREVVRGDALTITGSGWGDNCYDTGPPPAGEGVLGVPVTGISVYIVQGTVEWLVAAGDADAEYEFDVTVVVPSDLQPGAAEVQARYEGGDAYSQDPRFMVTDAPALSVAEATVAAFGPGRVTATTDESRPPQPSPASSGAPSDSTAVPSTDGDLAAGPGSGTRSASTPVLIVVGIAAALIVLGTAVVIARARRD
jgi:hypothetical protein